MQKFNLCAEVSTFSLSLDDPLDDLTPLQVSNVMDNIITANAFNMNKLNQSCNCCRVPFIVFSPDIAVLRKFHLGVRVYFTLYQM
ncbi:DUF2922 family protein [Sedimentibacter sp.]|uniref:DUF2922 family protein n=1 Tax=Sedimentibacter sp. TaxID=1960295 RepID=UPI0037D9CF65